MREYTITNQTQNGKQNIHIKICDISIDDILSCTDEMQIQLLCKNGCVNFNQKWSCPPYAHKISDIISNKGYKKAILICGYIYLCDMYYIKNPYQKVKAANMVLKSKCEKMARHIEKNVAGYALLSGSCNLCKPCYKKRGIPCKKSNLMRYSLESTGINVDLLLKKYCKHELRWYKKGFNPQYTSVATMILTNSINIDSMDFDFLYSL